MSVVETSYAARVDVITRLMKEKGISIKKLAEGAPVSERTLKRILQDGEKAHLATYRKLAGERALDVDDVSTLYVDDNPSQQIEPPPDSIPIDVVLDEDATTFDETKVSDIIAGLVKAVGAVGSTQPIFVINIILNSVTLRLSIALEYLRPLFAAFMGGELDHLKVKAITFRRQEPPWSSRRLPYPVEETADVPAFPFRNYGFTLLRRHADFANLIRSRLHDELSERIFDLRMKGFGWSAISKALPGHVQLALQHQFSIALDHALSNLTLDFLSQARLTESPSESPET